jgi:hypothetical protein
VIDSDKFGDFVKSGGNQTCSDRKIEKRNRQFGGDLEQGE